MLDFEAYRANPWRIYAAIFAFLTLVYLPVLTAQYAFLDSYEMLASGIQGQLHNILKMMVQGGRPLYAVYAGEAYGHATGIGDLSYMRAFGVAGIGALACLVYCALGETTLPHAVAIAGALLFCLTPSFQVYGAWDACSPFPWAALLAGLAFRLSDRGGVARWLGAAVLLTCSITIYQPAAMVFWDFAAIAWLLRAELPAFNRVVAAGAVMATALLYDFIAIKRAGRHGHALARATLTHDLHGKVIWFFQEPLFNALNTFALNPTVNVFSTAFNLHAAWAVYLPHANADDAVVLTMILLIGAWLYFGRNVMVRLLLALCLIPASYVPNLLVAENWASYRTIDALAGLFVVFAVIAALGWGRALRLRQAVPILCAGLVASAAWCASSNVTNEFAVPQSTELTMVQSALLHTNFPPGARPCFNMPNWTEAIAPVGRYDEFGALSTSQGWVPSAMAYLILHGRWSPNAALFTVANNVPTSVTPGCTVVDLRAVFSQGTPQ